MRWQYLALLSSAISLFAAQAYAQDAPEGVYKGMLSASDKYVMIPSGTTFEGRIDHTIGSSVSRAGESFAITLSAPLLANGQDVIVPAGSQVIGEVVEAIPSRTLPHPKKTPPLDGKLETQLTGLRTPDGITYPLVASLVGEKIKTKAGEMTRSGLGSGVGYVGDAQALSRLQQGRNQKGDSNSQYSSGDSSALNRNYGNITDRTRPGAYSNGAIGARDSNEGKQEKEDDSQGTTMRSLVRRNHDLFIDGGAPVTVRLHAAVKIALNPHGFQENVPVVRPAPSQVNQNSNSPQLMPVPGVIQSVDSSNQFSKQTTEQVTKHTREETTTRPAPESAF